MGVSKRKNRKLTKITDDDVRETIEKVQSKKKTLPKISDAKLFSTNMGKGNLKEKREKLKADRFKAPTYTKSGVDERIIKMKIDKMTRKALNPEQQVDAPKRIEEFGGELEDIWGNDGKSIVEVDKSNHMKRFKEGFSKKDKINVK
jgi:hypothetical protein